MAYNILKISFNDYMKHHWERTKESRDRIRMPKIDWELIWKKNYYQEKCEALEKELTKVKARLMQKVIGNEI